MTTSSIVACPSCKSQLRRPAGNADRIRCPKCQTVLKIGPASPTAPASAPAAPATPKSPPATAQQPAAGSRVVQCGSCNAKMKVAASAAGKKVRCPTCQSVMQVPASQPSDGSSSAGGGFASVAPSAPNPAASSPFDNLPSQPFPASPAPAAPTPAPSPFSQPMSSTAASSNPYAPTSSTMSSSSGGSPPAAKLWSIVGIAALVSFLVPLLGMIVFPPLAVIATIIGYGGGALASSVAGIWLLVLAFQEDVGQGLLCLFVPFYILYYMFKDWETTWLPSMVYWISVVVMFGSLFGIILGGVLSGV